MVSKLILPPSVEPVSVEETKLFLRVDGSLEDDLIGGLISAARQFLENWTGRAFITQTWEERLDAFPTSEIRLTPTPVISIVSLDYDDASGYEQTHPASAYTLDSFGDMAWLISAGSVWPSTIDAAASVRVRFVAGFGAPADVPPVLKLAIKLLVAHYYENRGVIGENVERLPFGIEKMISHYRVMI